MERKRLTLKDALLPIITFMVLIFLWEFIVVAKNIPGYILPTPGKVISVFFSDSEALMSNAYITVLEAAVGYAIAIVIALLMGILMDIIPIFKKCFYPIMLVTQMIPTITIAPLMLIWFGFGIFPKVILVTLTCFFPILISFVDGIESIDKDYLNLFKTMKASVTDTFIHLKLPMAMEELFSGLKISGTYAVMAATIAEWLGGTEGLGVYMVRSKTSYALDKVFASTIMVVLLSLLFVGIVFIAKRLIIRHK